MQEEDNLTYHIFPTLDHGLAWCEEQIIHTFTSVGLGARPKSFLQQVEDVLRQDAPPVDWLEHLRPDTKREEFTPVAPLKHYLQRVQLDAGAPIVRQGEQVTGLYVLEDGRAVAQTEAADGVVSALGTLEKHAVIGGAELYTQEPAAATIIADQPSTFLYLSRADMHRLEAEAPVVAIAVHRVLARMLGDNLARASHLVEALQR